MPSQYKEQLSWKTESPDLLLLPQKYATTYFIAKYEVTEYWNTFLANSISCVL